MKKRSSTTKGPSQRQLRAGELVRHALVEILQREGFDDPALRGQSITVSEVRCSPDLKQATVYCTPLGGGKIGQGNASGATREEIIAALNKAGPHLRGALGRKIEMKFTPALVFRSDDSFSEAERIDDLLSRPEVARDLKEADEPNG